MQDSLTTNGLRWSGSCPISSLLGKCTPRHNHDSKHNYVERHPFHDSRFDWEVRKNQIQGDRNFIIVIVPWKAI